MKKTLKYIVCASLLFNIHGALQAQQEETYNESVLVKGSYRPVIEQAEKVDFPAVITDTLDAINHTFHYNITPLRLKALYQPSRIKAARIIGEPATKLYNNYIRLGIGNYWSPLADLYWCSTRDTKKTYGFRLNHRSSWGTLPEYGKNHFGVTGVTLFGKYILDDKIQLSSDLNYEHDHNLYYGGMADSTLNRLYNFTRDDVKTSAMRAKYNVATWNVGVRNMELDVDKLGYSANLRLSDLWASWGQNEFNLNVSGDVHYGFDLMNQYRGVAYLRVEWDGYSHRVEYDERPWGYQPIAVDSTYGHRNIVKFNPYADFIFSGLQFHAGFTTAWDGFSDVDKVSFLFFPDVVVSKSLLEDALAVSLGLTGDLKANNWDVIRKINPYVGPGAEQRATRHYDLAAHARWSISKKLEANAEMGYSFLRDDLNFCVDPTYKYNNVFATHYVDDNRFTLGANITFVNDEMLTLTAGGHYYGYSLKGGDSVLLYRPDWDFLVGGNVNYNDKWLFSIESRLLGKMEADGGGNLPVRFGLNAEVEYRHNRALSFFLSIDNLAFQRYYYWAKYPSQRALFMLGLTYTIPHQ